MYSGAPVQAAYFQTYTNGSQSYSQSARDDYSYQCVDYAQAGWRRLYSSRYGDMGMYQVGAGNAQITGGTYWKPGGGGFADSSDVRSKRDIVTYPRGLAEILSLNPIVYSHNGKCGTIDDGRRWVGLIAQEVADIIPEMLVEDRPARRGLPSDDPAHIQLEQVEEEDALALDFVAPVLFSLVNAVKELKTEIDALKGGR
jgi:hypothetical protein